MFLMEEVRGLRGVTSWRGRVVRGFSSSSEREAREVLGLGDEGSEGEMGSPRDGVDLRRGCMREMTEGMLRVVWRCKAGQGTLLGVSWVSQVERDIERGRGRQGLTRRD